MNDLDSSYTEGSPICLVTESPFPEIHLSLLPEGWTNPVCLVAEAPLCLLLPSAPLNGPGRGTWHTKAQVVCGDLWLLWEGQRLFSTGLSCHPTVGAGDASGMFPRGSKEEPRMPRH